MLRQGSNECDSYDSKASHLVALDLSHVLLVKAGQCHSYAPTSIVPGMCVKTILKPQGYALRSSRL